MRKLTLICLISVSLLQACNDSTEPVASQSESDGFTAAELEGTSWELIELVVMGGFEFVPDDPAKYTVQFRSDNRVTGKSDCNTITAQWPHADSFAITDFGSTRSMCIGGSLHNYYTLYLRDVNGFAREDDQLVLTTPVEEVRLVFSASGN